jgi:hypothetical protein
MACAGLLNDLSNRGMAEKPNCWTDPRMTRLCLWSVTSGLPGHQGPEDYIIKGRGPIPATNILRAHCRDAQGGCEYRDWQVSTFGLDSNVRGIEGLFFPIVPCNIFVDIPGENADVCRGHFGIHRDANCPGSSGCPVFTIPAEFDHFCAVMADLRKQRIDWLPLEVVYTTES